MSAITPSTDLHLIKSPLELDMNNQMTFSDSVTQANYFRSLPHYLVEDISYQRKDGVIRFPAHIDSLLEYNYCMYKNSNYTNKWFYAFITNMEYINDNMTAIYIKTDPYQTFMFDMEMKSSFVEREHVSDDTEGLHTVPEGLDTGDFVCSGLLNVDLVTSNKDNTNILIAVQVSDIHPIVDDDTSAIPTSEYSMYTGMYNPCSIVAFPYSTSGLGAVATLIGNYSQKPDAILSVFLIPKVCATWTEKVGTGALSNLHALVPNDSWSATTVNMGEVPKSPNLNGYIPKNNKMFTKEFSRLYVTNNAGEDIEYNYEDYSGNKPSFTGYGCIEQGGSFKIAPTNSKKGSPSANIKSWNESISLGKLPTLSWISDYYLNWQAKNGGNIIAQTKIAGLNFLTSGLASATSAGNVQTLDYGYDPNYSIYGGTNAGNAILSGANAAIGLADNVRGIMQQIREASFIPDQSHGNYASGSITLSAGEMGFKFRNMTCRYEYAKRCDDYLSAFGYKVNSFKVPNTSGRANWNYVKCIDANIEGNIPQMYVQELKAMFNKGVTLWHNPNTFLDYSQSNSIVN